MTSHSMSVGGAQIEQMLAERAELIEVLKAICEDGVPLSGDDTGTEGVGDDLMAHARAVLAKVNG